MCRRPQPPPCDSTLPQTPLEYRRLKTIQNKTRRPLSVPLPGGKRLFLGPGKTGQIATKAGDHPPLVALVEAGELEILDKGAGSGGHNRGGGPSQSSGQDHNPGKNIFRSGDN